MNIRSVLQNTCPGGPTYTLRRQLSLRRQLMVSYVAAAFTTIGLVVVFAILCATYAGGVIKKNARGMMKDQVTSIIYDSSKYTADIITDRFSNHKAGTDLLAEFVRDRIVGYPDQSYEDDRHVPFFDTDSNSNKYPLQIPALPRDWNITLNMKEESMAEHFLERAPVYEAFRAYNWVTTASSTFFFQGNCNPMEKDPTGWTYYPNCTEANNDVETGGVVHPVNTTKWLSEKSAEISVFLKALWEADPDVTVTGVYFVNSGAGAAVQYPGFIRNSQDSYISDGCDWLREINPYTGEPFATEEEIARCHPKGTEVKSREYNPLERQVCGVELALHPEETEMIGPYKGTGSGLWFLTYRRAIFDRKTGHFIGCASYGYTVNTVARILDSAVRGIRDKSRLEQEQLSIGDYTRVALVRVNGTVAAGAGWDYSITDKLQHVSETGFVDTDTFEAMVSVVNWEEEWTPEDVAQRLRDNMHDFSGRLLSACPIPVPPEKYDPDYRPEFFVLFSIGREVFEVIDEMDESIDEDIMELTLKTGLIGLGGVTLLIVTVWFVSRTLTLPLQWISSLASRITNHHGESEVNPDMKGEDRTSWIPLACNTEIVQLVSEFNLMIRSFSGCGASNVTNKLSLHEIRNDLDCQNEIEYLRRHMEHLRDSKNHSYFTVGNNPSGKLELFSLVRNKKSNSGSISEWTESLDFKFLFHTAKKNANFDSASSDIADNSNTENSTELSGTKREISFLNSGENVHSQPSVTRAGDVPNLNTRRTIHSALFWWIVLLLVFPLLLTNALICTVVSVDHLNVLPSLVETSETSSYELELDSLSIAAAMRAEFVESALVKPLRDLYLLTRFSSWLLFGGIERSDSFTQLDEFAEECKLYQGEGSCPVLSDETRTPCDCKWQDGRAGSCTSFENNTRQFQKAWFACQASDVDETTGRRSNITSFPEFGSSPETTFWWTNASRVPGSSKGKTASGYETTYDRLRVISALSVAGLPIYNYVNVGKRAERSTVGTYFAFEADGMLWGYSGCNYNSSEHSRFAANSANAVELIRPDLCPLGKFGYDPRCSRWYDKGRKTNSPVYIASLPLLPPANSVAITAGSSLIDPRSGEYVGQTRVSIDLRRIAKALQKETASHFVTLITTEKVSEYGDTFIGPNYYVNHTSFSTIRNKMQDGLSGMEQFYRNKSDGSQENIRVFYAPIRSRTLQPVQPNDFARGSNFSYTLLLSLGVARLEDSLSSPFNQIKGDINNSLKRVVTVYLFLIGGISILCILFTCQISVAVTTPMITLLRIVQNVNLGRIKGKIPPMGGGSREVNEVYNSFAKLYKIGNVANTAFFSGNLDLAHEILSDALQLYRKMNDEKAVALASNNLGNVLFFIHRKERIGNHQCKKIDGVCCVSAALGHFNEAIEYGTKEFSSGTTNGEKAFLAHQLADRYFNRATFYLHLIGDPCCPENARELGFADLSKARTLDEDAETFWLKEKMLLKNFDLYFDLLLRRVHGLSLLVNIDSSVWNIWDPGALLSRADQMLSAAWDHKASTEGIGRVARLQQLEAATILLEMNAGNEFHAASLASRMLIEDEYLVDYAFVIAADALLRYVQRDPSLKQQDSLSAIRGNVQKVLRFCKNSAALDTGKGVVFCPALSKKWKADPVETQISKHSLSLYDLCCGNEDYVGLIARDDALKSSFGPVLGGVDASKQRSMISVASHASMKDKITCPLPLAVRMISGSSALSHRNAYILHVTDGSTSPDNCIPSVRNNISELNKKHEEKLHMLVIGLELDDEQVISQYEGLASVSQRSIFINSTRDSLDEAFNKVISLLLDQNNAVVRDRIQLGIAMETANRCNQSEK